MSGERLRYTGGGPGASAMPERGEATRQHIVETANRLFYRRGYNQTSFSDIADAAKIPRGNFYYYFKTKDDILAAVIDRRVDDIRALLADWDAGDADPRQRLRRFFDMVRGSGKDLARYGCPMGSLNIELGKAQPALKARARRMFDLFRDWISAQLRALGLRDPEPLALHLLGRAQGIAVVAQVYGDVTLLNAEVDQLEAFLDGLAPARR
jgi:AcrR family transcriptional regulator